VVRGTLVGLLTVVSFVPVHDLPIAAWLTVTYVVVFALTIASQFFQPARFTMVRDLVTGEVDRARAAGIAQATGQTATIIGPPLAAPLLFSVGVQWALLFNALSYAASFVAIRSVPSRAPEVTPERHLQKRAGVRADFVAGLRFFRGSKTLMTLLSVAVIGQCGIAPLDTLNVFFVSSNLHTSSHMYGYLGTALGVGGVIGALGTGRMVRWFGARTVTWVGIVLLGVLLAAYSRQTVFAAGLVLLFLLALPMTMVNTAVAPLLLGAAPREYVGRTTAVFNPVNQLAGMLATVVAGWLLSSALRGFTGTVAGLHFGPVDTIFLVSGGLIIVSGLYARTALRQAVVAPRPPRRPKAIRARPIRAFPISPFPTRQAARLDPRRSTVQPNPRALSTLTDRVDDFRADPPVEPRLAHRDAARLAELFAPPMIDELLADHALAYPLFAMSRNGARLPGRHYTCARRAPRAVTRDLTRDLPDLRAIRDQLAGGSTLILEQLHRTCRPVASFCRRLSYELSRPVWATAYLTPANAQGFGLHYDTHGSSSCSAPGARPGTSTRRSCRSRWTPSAGGGGAVRRGSQSTEGAGPARPYELGPGDVLWIPRGWLHDVFTTGTPPCT